ncbi:hypothetical protein, partial [Brevundimonas sp.]|uniref:hypothetical protein n=1 Tax=Brevundimonas sp. TaxID=1871086 RepID=UPI00286C2193
AGTTRAEMVVIFSESVEHVNLTAPTWAGGIRYENYVEPTSIVAETISSKDMDAFVIPADPDGEAATAAVHDVNHLRTGLDTFLHASWDERLIVVPDEGMLDLVLVPELTPMAAMTEGHNHTDWI